MTDLQSWLNTLVAVAFVGLFSFSAQAQTSATPLGIPVDARGGPTVDPTKNVLDLVLAAVKRIDDIMSAVTKRQDDLRASDAMLHSVMRESDNKRLNELRDAETRRINELAAQKQVFDLELARVIRANQDSSTLLLAAQLKEVKSDSNERTAKLEQFANEQRGRASAADPANIKLLEEVRLLSQQRAATSGQSEGAANLWALIVGGIGILVGAIVATGAVVRMRRGDAA